MLRITWLKEEGSVPGVWVGSKMSAAVHAVRSDWPATCVDSVIYNFSIRHSGRFYFGGSPTP
jgi:hypothetical protein